MKDLSPTRVRQLLQIARRLKDGLAGFKTPGTGEPCDPAILGLIHRAATTAQKPSSIAEFLDALPGSYVARYTGSSGPQVAHTATLASQTLKEIQACVRNADDQKAERLEQVLAFRWVVGWARRLLSTRERAQDRGRDQAGPGEGPGPGRGPGGTGRGPGGGPGGGPRGPARPGGWR